VHWFEIVIAAAFFFATVLMLADLLRRQTRFQGWFLTALSLGFAVATVDLVLHAVTSVRHGLVPFSGSSQVFNTLAWSFAVLVLYHRNKPRLFHVSVLLMPLALVSALLALIRQEDLLPLRGELTGALFVMHVGVLGFGTVSFCLSFLAGLLYLVAQKELKSKRLGRLGMLLPPLETLDRTSVRALVLGVVLLTIGNASGIYLAHVYWKVNWVGQTKFLFSMVAWAWFLLLLGIRHFAGWRGGRFFASLVVGFIFLLSAFSLAVFWNRPWI
jgi:ABC-type uncharacterized transport system permease subunit